MEKLSWKVGIRAGALLVTAALATTVLLPQTVKADAIDKPYLCLGADLRRDEKATVLKELDVDENDLDQYEILTVTNQDEHDYLDDYLSASVIGSRALSSVLIEKKKDGSGIHVTTKNITYCTEGMYENALTTAGIEDADVTVVGPFELTGTAALVGVMKAYEDMTGEVITEEVKDAATNELVVTGKIADEIGDSESAEELVAMLKEYVAEHGISSTSEIKEALSKCEEKLDMKLTDSQKEQIVSLMQKISDLDLDVNQLKEQAKSIYHKLEGIQIENQGFFEYIINVLKNIINAFTK